MGFSKMIELLQAKEKESIVLVNAGNFYIARGKDAVLLHNLLDLKVSCLETEICKVGFPLNSLEKYTKLIEERNYSYIVYNYDSKLGKLKVIKKYKGIQTNTEKAERLNCYICSNTVKMYKKTDPYIKAVANLYEEEVDKQKEEKTKEKKKIIWIKKRKKKISYS